MDTLQDQQAQWWKDLPFVKKILELLHDKDRNMVVVITYVRISSYFQGHNRIDVNDINAWKARESNRKASLTLMQYLLMKASVKSTDDMGYYCCEDNNLYLHSAKANPIAVRIPIYLGESVDPKLSRCIEAVGILLLGWNTMNIDGAIGVD